MTSYDCAFAYQLWSALPLTISSGAIWFEKHLNQDFQSCSNIIISRSDKFKNTLMSNVEVMWLPSKVFGRQGRSGKGWMEAL